MKLSNLALRTARTNLTLVGLSTLIGYLFGGGSTVGALIGFTISALATTFNRVEASQQFRRLSFLPALLIRSLYIVGAIVVALVLAGYSAGNADPFFLLKSSSVLVFSCVVSFTMTLATTVVRLLGGRFLYHLVIGKYHKPTEEDRVFLFLDLKDSTQIAERIGNVRFHSLLSDFYYDLGDVILETRGEIYKYVGDEVIVTWTRANALKDANCLRCYARMKEAIAALQDRYLSAYGLVPEFKVGIHGGRVVVGEIGAFTREIAFLGDVVNTTARIQQQCKTFEVDVLVSEDVLAALPELAGLVPREMGTVTLRGKENPTRLYTLDEAVAPRPTPLGV